MQKNFTDWILLFILSLTWGASFIFMKKGMIHLSSVQVGSLRLIFAFLFFLPFLFFSGIQGIWKYRKGLIWMGMFGNFIPAFLFTKAETFISSSLTGILNSTTPLFAWLAGYFVFKKRNISFLKVFPGFLLGSLGVFLLFVPDLLEENSFSQGGFQRTLAGTILVLSATACYGLSVQGIYRYLSGIRSADASAWCMTLLFPPALAVFFTEKPPDLTNTLIWKESILYVAVLGMAGSGLTLILYNMLIKRAGPVFAASCTYLIPFFSILWGMLDGEYIHYFHVLGLVVLLSGMFFMRKISFS